MIEKSSSNENMIDNQNVNDHIDTTNLDEGQRVTNSLPKNIGNFIKKMKI